MRLARTPRKVFIVRLTSPDFSGDVAISFCLRGREGWLDGSFKRDLEAVRKIGAGKVA